MSEAHLVVSNLPVISTHPKHNEFCPEPTGIGDVIWNVFPNCVHELYNQVDLPQVFVFLIPPNLSYTNYESS